MQQHSCYAFGLSPTEAHKAGCLRKIWMHRAFSAMETSIFEWNIRGKYFQCTSPWHKICIPVLWSAWRNCWACPFLAFLSHSHGVSRFKTAPMRNILHPLLLWPFLPLPPCPLPPISCHFLNHYSFQPLPPCPLTAISCLDLTESHRKE